MNFSSPAPSYDEKSHTRVISTAPTEQENLSDRVDLNGRTWGDARGIITRGAEAYGARCGSSQPRTYIHSEASARRVNTAGITADIYKTFSKSICVTFPLCLCQVPLVTDVTEQVAKLWENVRLVRHHVHERRPPH